MQQFLLAEEARGVFSEYVLAIPPYPLLDWAPECRGEGGDGAAGGEWKVELAFIWDGAGMLPTTPVTVRHRAVFDLVAGPVTEAVSSEDVSGKGGGGAWRQGAEGGRVSVGGDEQHLGGGDDAPMFLMGIPPSPSGGDGEGLGLSNFAEEAGGLVCPRAGALAPPSLARSLPSPCPSPRSQSFAAWDSVPGGPIARPKTARAHRPSDQSSQPAPLPRPECDSALPDHPQQTRRARSYSCA
jgi:hypothetical protein